MKRNYSTRLREEAAEIVEGALEPGESPAAFAAKALVFLAIKRKTGEWPAQLPPETLPRHAGRQPKPREV